MIEVHGEPRVLAPALARPQAFGPFLLIVPRRGLAGGPWFEAVSQAVKKVVVEMEADGHQEAIGAKEGGRAALSFPAMQRSSLRIADRPPIEHERLTWIVASLNDGGKEVEPACAIQIGTAMSHRAASGCTIPDPRSTPALGHFPAKVGRPQMQTGERFEAEN